MYEAGSNGAVATGYDPLLDNEPDLVRTMAAEALPSPSLRRLSSTSASRATSCCRPLGRAAAARRAAREGV